MNLEKIVDLYMNDYGESLARALHNKTGLPIYAMYDIA